MNQYLLSIYQPDGEAPPPHVLQAVMRDVDALRQEMKAAGAWVFAGGLHPPSAATVVRLQDGQLLTTDGPFAEGKEHIGGFSVGRAHLSSTQTRRPHARVTRLKSAWRNYP